MRLKRIISTICLVSLLTQNIPVNAVTILSENNNSQILAEEIIDSEDMTKDENNNSQRLNDKTLNQEVIDSENITSNESDINKEEVSSSESSVEEDSIKAITEITGSESIRVYLGEEIDYKDGIKATDTKGNDITDLVTVEGKVDNSKVGTYELKYSVKDELGNTATLVRKVKVIEKNTFNVYIEKVNEETKEVIKETLFSIYLDNKTSKFVVENQSLNMIDPSNGDEVAFQIKVIDKDNKEKLKIELLGEDTGDSKKLDALKELEYSYGDYIQIKPVKTGFSIDGPILGDIDTEKEDYSDGIDNIDYINNVRFKIVEDGIETIYNKAPEITWIEDMDNLLTTREEQLKGVEVIDDHDGVISNDKIAITEEKDESGNVIALRYSVEDSWGRQTSILRVRASKVSKANIQRSLSDNIITAKGISFVTENGLVDIRFKINIDPTTQKITVTERDGKIFSTSNAEYFRFTLYSSKGEVKHQVVMSGRDRSDGEKLDAIDNISFEYGDYIGIWHAESDEKLYIGGQVADVDTPNSYHDFSTGVPSKTLERRFRITTDGLTLVSNKPPTINGADTDLEIERGSTVDLLQGITVTDDLDGDIPNSQIKVDSLDTSIAGIHNIQYEVSDSWGEKTTVVRKVTVREKNDIDGFKINVMNKDGSKRLFTISFDELSKEIRIVNKLESGTIDSSNKGDAFILKIYNKFGRIKKTFRIKGNTDLNSNIIISMDKYKYVEGDYISVWAINNDKGIKIEGNIQNEKEDYDDGIQDVDYMDNVRFQLIDGKVNSIYNSAPEITGADDKTIKRGETFNPLDGISVRDDHDTELTSNNIEVIFESGITAENINLIQGRHTVTYKLKDSWGREKVVNRTINVDPKNKLEETQIVVKSNITSLGDDNVMLKIGFDTILNKLTVDYYNDELYIDGNSSDTAFKIAILDSNNSEKSSFTLNYDSILTSNDVNNINNISYENGDKVSVEVYDPENGISVTGEIISSEASYNNGFSHHTKLSEDIMLNTLFEISENGLDDKYNNAPVILGLNEGMVVKGRTFDEREGVSVDDEDKSLDFKVTGEVKTDIIGTYTLTYTAMDSHGRITSAERTIYVVPEYADTYVELKNSNDEKLFSIGLNRFGNGFTLKDLSNEAISSDKNDAVFRFTIFDASGEKVDEIELLGTDVPNSDKLKKLESINFRQGYSFSIWSNNSSNLMVSGKIIKETINVNDQFTNEDYADGISNEDLMVNVRFKISDENLEAVYNSAPVLSIKDDYSMYRGESINLTDGVTVDDDIDTLDISDVKITIDGVEATKEKLEELSEATTNEKPYVGTLNYQISDKWGRTSQVVSRKITIKPGMERHEFKFQGRIRNTNGSTELFFDAIKFKFNTSTMRFELLDRSDKLFSFHTASFEMYSMTILSSDKKVTKGEWKFTAGDKATDSQYDSIGTIDIEYGDIIKFTTNQGPKLTITGEMYNTHSDYSEGITSGHNLKDTEFVITKNGLVENHSESIVVPENKNIISILTGFVGSIYMNIQLNTNTKRLEISDYDVIEPLEYRYKTTNMVRFEFYSGDGKLKTQFNLRGEHYNNDSAVQGLFTNIELQEGDYFTMVPSYEPNAKLFRILGDLEKEGDVEDFSDGVDNIAEASNTRFYIKSTGEFKAVHNEAPVINIPNEKDGVVNIPVGSTFDKNFGVTVDDDKDTNLTFSSTGDVNTSVVGDNKVTYTAKDSWGRTTTKVVTFKVRPKAFFNQIEVYREADKANPAFVIGIDNDTNKYTVTSYSDDVMDSYTNNESVFKLWVIDKNNSVKASLDILGLDQADSTKLDVLRNTQYEEGDKIKVWRAGDPSNNIDTLKITGDILEKREDYSDGIENIDNMNNVAFEITSDGLKSIYNNAANFINVEDKVIYKGDKFDAKDGISVYDVEDGNIDIDEVEVIGTVDTSKLDDYTISYMVSDKWGRVSYKTVTISVVSRSTLNTFEFYKSSSLDENNKNFTIGLDYSTSKYKVTGDSTEEFDSSNPNEVYAQITIYDRFGKVIKDIELLGSDSAGSKKLLELNDISYSANQTIRIYNKNPQAVKVKGNVLTESGSSNNNYENGFKDEDEMIKTRFKITDDGLIAVKHKDATFDGLSDLTINRGEEVNLFDSVNITHPTEEVQVKDVKIKNFNNLIIGEQTITYEYLDSWGVTSSATRKVIVEPRNELEKNIIQLTNSNDNRTIMDISFDTIEMKFTFNVDKSALEGIDSNELLKINVFNINGESKADITITKENINDDSIKAEIESIILEYDDYVSFEAYDIKNGFKIQGNINGELENYKDGVDNDDNIENVRFKVLENGLESQYNKAPEFINLTEKEIFRGDDFNPLEDISVKDDIDGDIDVGNISIDKDLDTDTIGKQVLTYTVSDSWGRTTTMERIIWVKSIVDTNKAQFYNSKGELLFEFGFDSKTNQYVLKRGTVEGEIDPSGGSGKAIELTIYDEEGNKENSITINSDDTVKSNKLDALNGTNYTYGKSMNIKINDITKIKFKGEGTYFKSGFKDGVDVNYNEFITDRDYLDNVRIKITELGIEVIYNKAPKIEIEKLALNKIKYKTLEEYNLLEGVTLSDDYDELSIEDVEISKGGNILTDDMLSLGEHTLTYTIKDKWGRESDPIERTINITSSIETNVIEIGRMYKNGNDAIRVVGVEVRFNHNEKKLKAIVQSSGKFSWHTNALEMYKVKLIGADDKVKYEKAITSLMTTDAIADELNDLDFEYGDKLILGTNQGTMLKIHGSVLDAEEDYSDGVDFGYILENTVFTLTENGFEAEVSDSYIDEPGENTITWLAGYNGLVQSRIIIDHKIGLLKVPEAESQETHVDTLDHSGVEHFSIKLYNSGGDLKVGGSFHGRSEFTDVFDTFNNQPFEVGDYFEIRVGTRPGNLRISGEMSKDQRITENYQDGIDDVDFVDNVRFYIRDSGIEAVYNSAPVVSGAEDAVLVKDRDNELGEVKVSDDHDSEKEINITEEGLVKKDQIGAYLLSYIATDTWGRSTVFDRFVVVQAPPVIEVNKEKKIVELGSITKDEVDDYLKTELVTITDEEDDRDKKKLDIKIEGTIDPDEVNTYTIKYTVVDSDGHETTETIEVEVIKTINVSVPLEIPFQIVTNLIDKNADPFIAGILNISNNSTTSVVDVSLKLFEKVDDSGDLEIVSPNAFNNWNDLSEEDTMTKMALGMYSKEGFNNTSITEDSPLWLTSTMNITDPISIGQLSKATDIANPKNGKLSFVSKHGEKFIGGRSKAKFRLVFEFK
jgi:methionine-rich copper-binding protein CopC